MLFLGDLGVLGALGGKSERLKQDLHHARQSAAGVADELLEDLVRHRHEFFHAGQALTRRLHVFTLGGGFAQVRFVEHVPGTLHLYRFGHKTADFVICRNCGTYIGAKMQSGDRGFGIVNARVLLSLAARFAEPQPTDLDKEDSTERLARRESRWTPLELGPR